MKKSDRFIVVDRHKLEMLTYVYVLEDKFTGVQYLGSMGTDGFSGLTPLLNADGKPVIGGKKTSDPFQ